MISASSPTTYSDNPIEETVRGPSVATARRLAGWSSVTSVPSTPRFIAGCTIMPRPRRCARTCSSRRCARLANSKMRVASGLVALDRGTDGDQPVAAAPAGGDGAGHGAGKRLRGSQDSADGAAGPGTERASPPRTAAASHPGPADAYRLLRRRQQPAADERAVRLAGGHDQAAAARRPSVWPESWRR